jgi:hypothetical protein
MFDRTMRKLGLLQAAGICSFEGNAWQARSLRSFCYIRGAPLLLRRTGGAGRWSIAQRGRQIWPVAAFCEETAEIGERGARTMAYDSAADRAYVVTADFGPAPAATAENPRPRPAIISGTFRVIVIGR